jgi:hypothetical protein
MKKKAADNDFYSRMYDLVDELKLADNQAKRREFAEFIIATGAAEEFVRLSEAGESAQELHKWIVTKRKEKGLPSEF